MVRAQRKAKDYEGNSGISPLIMKFPIPIMLAVFSAMIDDHQMTTDGDLQHTEDQVEGVKGDNKSKGGGAPNDN